MKSGVAAILILFHFASSTAAAQNDTLRFTPTTERVDVVINQMLLRLGADSLQKVHDRSTIGELTIEVGGRVSKGSVLILEAEPNKRTDEMTINGKSIKHIVDGRHAWIKEDTLPAKELTGRALESDLAGTLFNPELHLLDTGSTVALLGTTRVDTGEPGDTVAYVLRVSIDKAEPELWYVSAKRWLIVERARSAGGRLQQVRYRDFRVVDGVTYPFRLDIGGFQSYSLIFTSIRHNTHPNSTYFQPDK